MLAKAKLPTATFFHFEIKIQVQKPEKTRVISLLEYKFNVNILS